MFKNCSLKKYVLPTIPDILVQAGQMENLKLIFLCIVRIHCIPSFSEKKD